MPTAADKYREAIELYKTTDLALGEISKRCGVTRTGLSAYIYRCHRDLMLRRNGISGNPQKNIRKNKGQRPETREKYREAIEACDSEKYIELNVSQIARLFNLDGPALANQLRAHYPDVIPRREAERRRRGIADNIQRGVRKSTREIYAAAIELLQNSDITIEDAANTTGVSYSGLHQHLIFYHKNIADERATRREAAKHTPKIGTVSGNGRIRAMSEAVDKKYAEGVELYRTTDLSVKEIAQRIGVNVSAFRMHLRLWHSTLMLERRSSTPPHNSSDRPSFAYTKRYSRATKAKYAEAINFLKSSTVSTEEAAKKFGFSPEVFRAYLKEHEPELFNELGMTLLPNGRKVLKRSYDKYAKAIRAYASGAETLKAIAERFNIPYSSLSGFLRRNFPEIIRRR